MEAAPPEPPPPADPTLPERDAGRLGVVALIAGALTLGGLCAALAGGRVLHGPPALLAVVVFFLPHLFALLGTALLGAWVLARRRRALLVLLALTLSVVAVAWGPGWVGRSQGDVGAEVDVLSWNVHRLWGGPEDGGDPVRCVEATLRRASPDVLALMEVSAADVATLSGSLGMSCVHVDYLGTGGSTQGGLAACVRDGSPWSLKSTRTLRFEGADPWYYVFAEVQRDWRVFNVLAVHLQPYSVSSRTFKRSLRGSPEALAEVGRSGEATFRAQGAQTRALLERVGRLRDPTVLAGDLNSTRDAALHTDLRRHLVDAWERGGSGFGGTVRFLGLLPLRVDHVYASDAFAVRGARVLDAGCSDHRPVLASLTLR